LYIEHLGFGHLPFIIKIHLSSLCQIAQTGTSFERYGGTRFSEQRQLHLPQKHKATVADFTLRVEMNGLEEQADNAKARELFWKPLSWLGTIRPTSANDAFDPALWETFISTTLGLEVPTLAALPRLHSSPLAKCGCKKFCMDFHGDHTSTCTSHSGATAGFCDFFFYRPTGRPKAHFTAAGMPSQCNQSESFRFKRAAFYQGLKSKVGLAAAKAAALRINLHVQGCSIVAAPMHAPSRTSLLLPLLLSHNLPLPRVH
jgi:hypothetical protein